MKRVYQGDLMIEEITENEITGKKHDECGRVILVSGEATGHNHVVTLTDQDELWRDDENGAIFLRLARETALEHVMGSSTVPTEEHAPVVLLPGVIRISRQVEEVDDEIRRVAD